MEAVLDKLRAVVGADGWISDAASLEPHLTEWRGRVRGATPLMLLPATSAEVAELVRICAAEGLSIVPQGGNTGMCAGAVPDASGQQILLNLRRMNRIRRIDPDDYSLIADAGCVLADLQEAAREVERFLPLSLGGEGSCQIGGNVATNAGGINVLRYGTTRDLVLGLEVVLADGQIWDGLRTVRKDTAGYDLKQLFIGSEGTLGIITGVALRLFPPPGDVTTAFIGLSSAADAVRLLSRLRAAVGDVIQAFELIAALPMQMVMQHIANARLPVSEHAWYVLTDVATPDRANLESVLAAACDDGLAGDVAIAKSGSEAEGFWRLRHSISEAEKRAGVGGKHDISVPSAAIGEFVAEAERRLAAAVPGVTPVVFGHVGDGNLHYNVLLSDEAAGEGLAAASEVIYALVRDFGGSISAEHGIGTLKKAELAQYGAPAGLELMQRIKTALDPRNTLNPGKVI